MEESYKIDISYFSKNKLIIQAPSPKVVMMQPQAVNPYLLAAAASIGGRNMGVLAGRRIALNDRQRIAALRDRIPKDLEFSVSSRLGTPSTMVARLSQMTKREREIMQRDIARLSPQQRVNVFRNYIANNQKIPDHIRSQAIEIAIIRQQKALDFAMTGQLNRRSRAVVEADNARRQINQTMKTWSEQDRNAANNLSSLLSANPLGRQYLHALRQQKAHRDTLNIGQGE